MASILNEEQIEIINRKDTLKSVATVSKDGIPHIAYKGSLHVNEDGQIVLYEILESSRNNRNLVYSLWYDKTAAVQILGPKKESYEILAKPVRSITAGREFEQVYRSLREKKGDIDLGAIWILEPVEIRNEELFVRQKEEEAAYPILKHLDRV